MCVYGNNRKVLISNRQFNINQHFATTQNSTVNRKRARVKSGCHPSRDGRVTYKTGESKECARSGRRRDGKTSTS